MSANSKSPSKPLASPRAPASSLRAEIEAFAAKTRAARAAQPGGRLIFAMDATASRQPTWDLAVTLQASMFDAIKTIGGLHVQLVYFRDLDECRAGHWASDPAALGRQMSAITCRAGSTQIQKVLKHTLRQATEGKVSALVFVGDAMEENPDVLVSLAGELAQHSVPVFIFHEGDDATAHACFEEIAKITRGAVCQFGSGSAAELRELLQAIAVFVAGGIAALQDYTKTRSSVAPLLLGLRRAAEFQQSQEKRS
jgi:hypothetical protein